MTRSYQYNDNFYRHAGYDDNYISPGEKEFFSQKTVDYISTKVSEMTMGFDSKGRKIVVPSETILGVMNEIWRTYKPLVGSIYSRYHVPVEKHEQDKVTRVVDQVIEIIVADIQTNYDMQISNSKLNAWNTVYGEHNEHGIRSHAPVKIRNKHPTRAQFFMNY